MFGFRFVSMALIVLICGGCSRSNSTSVERIGIYDSRAIAVAYAGSAQHEANLERLKASLEKAELAKNKKEAARLKKESQESQKQMHLQTFSTHPVDNILAEIEEELPAIRQKAGVDILISKWDKKTLRKYRGAKQIDVTADLVEAFHPNRRQRNSAEAIQEVKPFSTMRIKLMHAFMSVME